MTAECIDRAAHCRRLAALLSGPQPQVRVCWLICGSAERGRGELLPLGLAREIVARSADRIPYADFWIQAERGIG